MTTTKKIYLSMVAYAPKVRITIIAMRPREFCVMARFSYTNVHQDGS